jgi:hypothetical protein
MAKPCAGCRVIASVLVNESKLNVSEFVGAGSKFVCSSCVAAVKSADDREGAAGGEVKNWRPPTRAPRPGRR